VCRGREEGEEGGEGEVGKEVRRRLEEGEEEGEGEEARG
jgi:hypothetical protein